tara:strand:- start:34918 stop:35082 length:165 start_codon:yes stop_codon:yes gene_type:complete
MKQSKTHRHLASPKKGAASILLIELKKPKHQLFDGENPGKTQLDGKGRVVGVKD